MRVRQDVELTIALNVIMAEVIAQNERKQINDLKREMRTRHKGYTVATFCSGGCLDTIASALAGYTPIWGTETCERRRALWADLTDTPDLGDTFNPEIEWETEMTPDLLWSGQPCPEWSVMGSQRGLEGTTGWMFLEQWKPILRVKPKSFILEQVDNILKVNDGAAVDALVDKLQGEYVIYQKVIAVRDHNDLSNRKRLFIVGISKTLGDAAYKFKFPNPVKNSVYKARDIADPDRAVPEHQWVNIPHGTQFKHVPTDAPGDRLHKLAKLGPGPGHSRRPNDLYSWDGNMNTGTTHNGGGIRPPLKWRHNQRMRRARKTTQNEARRAASLMSSYLEWIKTVDDTEEFAYTCINMGVPIRTAQALSDAVQDTLREANAPQHNLHELRRQIKRRRQRDKPATVTTTQRPDSLFSGCIDALLGASTIDIPDETGNVEHTVRTMQVDSGCDKTIGDPTHNEYMTNARDASGWRIMTADDDGGAMKADKIGTLNMYVANTSGHPNVEPVVDVQEKFMTVPKVRRTLMSIEDKWRDEGYELKLPQPENGACYFSNVPSGGDETIPIRHDDKVGGFWVDYIPYNPNQPKQRMDAYRATLDYVTQHREENNCAESMTALGYNMYNKATANNIDTRLRCQCGNAITDIITCQEIKEPATVNTLSEPKPTRVIKTRTKPDILARHPDDVEIRGVKTGLKRGRDKLTLREWHHDYGHLGECPGGCKICDMVKGVMRRIPHTKDPYISRTPLRNWSMDMVTVSDRSEEGHKYMVVLRSRDQARLIKTLFLHTKDEAWSKVAEWIRSIRKDPIYNRFEYDLVSHIKTDRDGAWDHDTAVWQKEIVQKLGVEMEYISPDRHSQNGHAERACGIVETTLKSLLISANLEPKWWVRAAQQAEWLLNRLPPISSDYNISIDGDRVRPLQIATNFYYSQRQIDRELSYFVPIGTPCLVHDTLVKGSNLAPKVRWGIACGMYRETVQFKCPFVKSVFHSKSYTAYKLRPGLNYATFLGIKPMQSTRRSLVIPGDEQIKDTDIVLDLPEPTIESEVIPREVQLYSPELDARETQSNPGAEHGTHPSHGGPDSEDAIKQTPNTAAGDGDSNPDAQSYTWIDECPGRKPTLTRKHTRDSDKQCRRKSVTFQDAAQDPQEVRGTTPIPTYGTDPNKKEAGPERGGTEAQMGGQERDESDPEPHNSALGLNDDKGPNDKNESDMHENNNNTRLASPQKDTTGTTPDRVLPGGGTITVRDAKGQPLYTRKTGELESQPEKSDNSQPQDKTAIERWGHHATGDMWDVMIDDEIDWDKHEAKHIAKHTITSKDGESFRTLMRRMKGAPHPDLMDVYRIWLVEHSPLSHQLTYEMIPESGSRRQMQAGIKFPPPSGRAWRILCEQHAEHVSPLNDTVSKADAHAMVMCLAQAYEDVKRCHNDIPARAINAMLAPTADTPKSVKQQRKSAATYSRRTRTNAVTENLRTVPKTLKQAFEGPDAEGWREAADLEMDTLTNMGTVSHGYTLTELQNAGITKPPINMSVALTDKMVNGVFERHKVRMAIAGHKWNMQKGIDYTDVYAPAPNQNTARFMAAMTAQMRLHRKAWDIKLAYCWADLPADQPRIAIKYPKYYERYRTDKGSKEPEYMVLMKNCYGLPAAGKAWADHRDKYMLSHFNKNGYKCVQCTYDPCLFYITKGERINLDSDTTATIRPYAEEAWVSIHTDDCDAIGTSDSLLTEIYTAHNTKWQAKIVDANFMLGIHRDVKTDEHGTRTVLLTQTAYVDGMIAAFEEDMIVAGYGTKKVTTPFPQNVMLQKSDASEEEGKLVTERGYQRAVGMLLWATRGTYPECQQGVNQLGSVLSNPSEHAWKCAMHLMKWMHDHREQGLLFSSNGNMSPIIFSDASNKPEPDTGLSRYGFAAMLAGGPIATTSKKLAHVGLSAFHNEYMALRHAAGQAMWVRNLAHETGLHYMIREPTLIYGDNMAANKLTKEDFISTNNQYIYLPYHWIKELVRGGEIEVRYVPTKHNISDVFTKSVGPDVIHALLNKLTGHDHTWVTDAYDSYYTARYGSTMTALYTPMQWYANYAYQISEGVKCGLCYAKTALAERITHIR